MQACVLLAMRTPYDTRNKEVLRDLFAPAGTTGTDEEVAPDAQHIDVWFVPDPLRAAALAPLGLLGRLARTPSAFEPFHRTPDVAEVLACVRKHLAWQQVLARRVATDAPSLADARMWLVSSGRPEGAIAALGFARTPRTVRGLYALPRGFGIHLVVVNELARSRDTLLLRLMGRGRTLRDAMRDLAALPHDALEARVVVPHLLRLKLVLLESADPEDREILMQTDDAYARWERDNQNRGFLRVFQHQIERRLARPLSAHESATLHARLRALGPERVSDVVLDLTPDALAAWLADPSAT